MEKEHVSDNRITAGNTMLVVAIVLQTIALWNEYEWYELVARIFILLLQVPWSPG